MNQRGFLNLIIYLVAALVVFGGLFAYLFYFDKGSKPAKPTPQPSPTFNGQVKQDLEEASQKQKQFEENKTEIKSKLDLNEQQYQLLKQYSSN